ncbi:MAG: hypothetical protein ACMUHB_07115 [Thermoplasmatota archaeon]
MGNIGGRALSLGIILLMVAVSLPFVLEKEDEAAVQAMEQTRGTRYYLDGDFYVGIDWSVDDLFMVVFLQNTDVYPGRDATNGDKFYNYMEIANSYAIPLDGKQHSSGGIRRPLVELFTATDCGYCPSSEESLSVILDDRTLDEFSLIEWHRALEPGNDPYETGGSGNRFITYNVTATPTVIFDGQLGRSGGDSSVNSPVLVSAYNKNIDRFSVREPFVSLFGSGQISGDQAVFNVSFEVIDALPRGNWTLNAILCEDLQKDHNGATMRHTQRRSFSQRFWHIQDDYPVIDLKVIETFKGQDPNKVMGDLDLKWSASDPQDGTALTIDLEYSQTGATWDKLAEGLSNTGSFKWDTTTVEDGKYYIRVLAKDSDGNSILSGSRFDLVVNNPDFPVGDIVYPREGSSLSREATILWNSSDDEDVYNDLLVKISIRSDPSEEWEPITYNPITQSDWEVNTGSKDLNTLVFEDLSTYVLKIELKDTDEMITEMISPVFEIYNNDAPVLTFIEPSNGDIVTGTLVVGWKVVDEEDAPMDEGLTGEIDGNISIKRTGSSQWTELFMGPLPAELGNMSFDTSSLMGDGDYAISLTVTDSRGRSDRLERQVIVYDPDSPQFTSPVEGPANVDDYRKDTLRITWSAEDPDAGETLGYRIEITPAGEDEWTVLETSLEQTSYDIDLTGLDEGRYLVRVTARDSSKYKLSQSVEYGPFFYNKPEPPVVSFLSPPEGFNGTLEDGVNNDGRVFTYDIVWSYSDPDMDNVTLALFYKKEFDNDWTRIEGGLTSTIYTWNLTNFMDGKYLLRLVATDSSEKALKTEVVLGPFSVDIPWYPPVTDDDDEEPVDDDEDDTDTFNVGLIIGIAVGSVVLVVLIVVGILLVLNKTTRKKVDVPVMPAEGGLDLSIPEFDRAARPVYSGQMVTQGAYAGIEQPPLPAVDQPALGYAEVEQNLPPAGQPPMDGAIQEQPMVQEEAPIPFQAPDLDTLSEEQALPEEQEFNEIPEEEPKGIPQAPPPLPPDLD